MVNAQSKLKLKGGLFSSLLNASESITSGNGEPDSTINNNEADVPLLGHEEVIIGITQLKNYKAAGANGLPAELFKYGGEELIRSMHQFLCRIYPIYSI